MHVPTDAEYTVLTDYLGGESVAGGKMKEEGTEHWNSPNTGATNESGFTLLPGGERHYSTGAYSSKNTYALLWSTTEEEGGGLHRLINYNSSQIDRRNYYKRLGLSVRCLKD